MALDELDELREEDEEEKLLDDSGLGDFSELDEEEDELGILPEDLGLDGEEEEI